MKNYATKLLLAAILVPFMAGAQKNLGVTAGLRTGAMQEFNTLTRKMTKDDQYRDIRKGWYHQVFVNKELGKKRNWMVEASAGYSAYSYENEGWVTDGINDYYYYSFSKNHVYDVQLKGRYLFFQMKELKWKHYAGITLGLNWYRGNWYSFGNTHNINEFDRSSGATTPATRNYTGLEYFGKLELSRRLSLQYLLNYAYYAKEATLWGSLEPSEPDNHRVNLNFGLGWQF